MPRKKRFPIKKTQKKSENTWRKKDRAANTSHRMPSALAKGTLRDAKKKNPQEIRKPLPPVPASKPDYKQRLFAEAVKVVFPRDNGNEKPSPHQQPHNLSAFEKPYPEENERNPQATEKSLPPHIQHGLPAFEKLVIQNGPAHQPELHNPVHTAPSVKAQHCVTPDHRHLGQRKPVQGVKPVDAAAAGKAAFAKTQQGHSSYVRRKPAPGRGLGESSALAKGSLRQPGGKVQKSTPKAEVEPWKNDELDHEEHGGKQANNHAHTNLHIQNPFGGIFQSKSIKNESKANTCVRVSEHDEDMVEADDTEEQKSTPHSRPVTAREKDPEFAFFKFGVDTPPAKQRPAAAESSQSLWPRPHLFKKGTQKKASKADGPAQARPEPIPWAASCLDEEPEGTKDDSQPWWAEYHRRLEDAKRDDVKKAKAVAKSHISRPVNGTQVFAADRFNPVHYDKTTPVQTKHLHEDPEQGHDEPKRETAWGDFVNPFKHKEHRKPEGPSKLLNVISNKTHTRTESSHKHSRSHSSNTNVSLALHIMNKLSGSSRHTTDSDMSFACVGIDSPIVAERGAAYAALEGTEFPTCTNCGQVMIGSGRSQCVDCESIFLKFFLQVFQLTRCRY